MNSLSSSTERLHVFWHEGMLEHDAGSGVFDSGLDPGFLEVLDKHPENSDRVRNMVSILRKGPISPFLTWHSGRPAQVSELLSFHSQEYIEKLVQASEKEARTELCAGTFINHNAWSSALLAAGTTLSAMELILSGQAKLAFALVRPPGHHAQPTQADGYCFLNNASLAVKLASNTPKISKITTVDIDVHFGNGTSEGFYANNQVQTLSLHMNHGSWGPSHPQNGSVEELGTGNGYGFNLNVPLPNGSGDEGYGYAFRELVVPAVRRFQPKMIVFVIGQDSSAFDPNGRQCLTMEGYRNIGRIMRDLADEFCDGRMLIVQEGGYHVTYSAYCLHATLEGVLKVEEDLLVDPIAYYPEDCGFTCKVVDEIKKFWKENVDYLKDI